MIANTSVQQNPSDRQKLPAQDIRALCLESGADDVGFVEISRPALDFERDDILAAYRHTQTIICIAVHLNPENMRSLARHISSDEFHHATDSLNSITRTILRRLKDLGVRGVVMPADFPMDMSRFPGKTWNVSHKLMAVESGIGNMGLNRLVIHPEFGNFIRLTSLLIDTCLDSYGTPLPDSSCDNCGLCLSACPVGAIQRHEPFDFMSCMTHAYRDNIAGFMDMLDSLLRSTDMNSFRQRFSDRETASMWQSLMYKMNYRCGYCMAVCPAGQAARPVSSRKEFVQEVVLPLKNRPEQVYVAQGSKAEKHARANPNKDVRLVGFQIHRSKNDL